MLNGSFLFCHFHAAKNRLGVLSNARVKTGLEYDCQCYVSVEYLCMEARRSIVYYPDSSTKITLCRACNTVRPPALL